MKYIDEDTNEEVALAKTLTVDHGTEVDGADHVIAINDYVYTSADTATITEDGMSINVYYSADKNDDDIPDKYQIPVTYSAVNGTVSLTGPI